METQHNTVIDFEITWLGNSKIKFLKEDGSLSYMEDSSDLDLDFSKNINVAWVFKITSARSACLNMSSELKNNQELNLEMEIDTDIFADLDGYKIKPDGYQNYNLTIVIDDNVETSRSCNLNGDLFLMDFAPQNLKLDLLEIIQIDDYNFKATVKKAELEF